MISTLFKRKIQRDRVARIKMHSSASHIGSVCGTYVRRVVAQRACAANDIDHIHAKAGKAQACQTQTALQITAEVRATGVVLISTLFKRNIQRDRVVRCKNQSGAVHCQCICAVNVQFSVGGAAVNINDVHTQRV